MPKLSLCVIARDEEAMLPACLVSVKGVVDEIIVVDTGSEDATPQLAEQAGATVVRHAWSDDFSAARNAGLDACSGDWVLVLDADERLAPKAGKALRRALRDASFHCGLLPLHNAASLDAEAKDVLSGAARRGEPILLPRLLRRGPDLRYRGVIHESVGQWLVEGGYKTARIEAAIVHYGAIPEYRTARAKDARNLALLERRCAQDPDDPVALTYLARERYRAGDQAGAVQAVEQAWSALEAVAKPGGPNPSYVPLADMRVQFQLASGEDAAALHSIEQCHGWGSKHPNLGFLEGRVRYALAVSHPDQAHQHLAAGEAALSRALSQGGQAFTDEVLPGATGGEARYHRGLIRILAGRTSEALGDFEACLAEQPEHQGALLGRVECLVAAGQPQQAIKGVEPLLRLELPDGWVLAALACDLIGSAKDVGTFIDQAQARLEHGFAARHRVALFQKLRVAAGLYRGQAPTGPGQVGRVAALVARRPIEDPIAMVDGPELEHLVVNLVRAGQGSALASLLEPRAEDVLPGIGASLAAIFDKLGLSIEDDGEPDFVFIGGAGRSGTTLFRSMLNAHPRIHCGPEAKLVPAICQLRDSWLKGLGADLTEAGVDTPLLDRAVRSFLETFLEGLAPEGQRVAEKTPHNLVHTAYLGRLFPQARFLHVIRDGRAVVSSLLQQRWIDPGTGKPVWYCADARSAARYWHDVVAGVRQQATAVPGRYLEVRYERLVTEPRAVMVEVLAFLGESWHPAVLRHHEGDLAVSSRESSTDAVRSAVNTAALDKWRSTLDEQQLSGVREVAGSLLDDLGYRDPPSNAGPVIAR